MQVTNQTKSRCKPNNFSMETFTVCDVDGDFRKEGGVRRPNLKCQFDYKTPPMFTPNRQQERKT